MTDPASPYAADLGSAWVTPAQPLEVASFASYILTYRAGRYGIDDGSGIRVLFRLATDQTPPQFTEPQAPGYTTLAVSGDFSVRGSYSRGGFARPYIKGLEIGVGEGCMRAGDEIRIHFGDTSAGSPGMRVQTFAEDRFEFRVLANPFGTRNYLPLPDQPTLPILPGPGVHWRAVLPSLMPLGTPFRLGLRMDDVWGNPSHRVTGTVHLKTNLPVAGMPDRVTFTPDDLVRIVDGLSVHEPGELVIELADAEGSLLARSNPLQAKENPRFRHFWGDMHGQSAETVGTNTAAAYFVFARDCAFLDAIGHQGNDFQVTKGFWDEINRLSVAFEDPGRFVAVPGYEWSGNTTVGGDHNVYFYDQGRPIRRSSHAMLTDLSDLDTDCATASDLFKALLGEDAVVNAHVGGRYADVRAHHDGRVKRSVEIHSAWGTFEWILMDSFAAGHRVGVVANSDGHKGRPGASHPGASMFGAFGGLTCFLTDQLSRDRIMDCWRARHHYATTGARIHLDVRMGFQAPARLFADDPGLGAVEEMESTEAVMGDIVAPGEGMATLRVEAAGTAPLLTMDLFDGPDLIDTFRPYGEKDLGSRIRVVWEGARYRGRGRAVTWDGAAILAGNAFADFSAVNFFNAYRPLAQTAPGTLAWHSMTTGNFAGFQARLKNGLKGRLRMETPPVTEEVAIKDLGLDDKVFPGEGLGVALRLRRLPDEDPPHALTIETEIPFDGTERRLFIRVTQADGHQAWSSPIYLIGAP